MHDSEAAADAALAHRQHDPLQLVQMLVELQGELGWLPPPALERLALALGLPLAQVRGVAGFYRFLHQQPVGRYRILFSDNVIERHQGSQALMARLCQRLGLAPGVPDADGRASVDSTSCIGLSDQGPSALVNHRHVLTRLDAARIDELAERVRADEPPAHWPAEWRQVAHPVRRADALLATPLPRGAALAAALACGPEATLAELERSGLRGRGGAGFPTAKKWALCRAVAAPERVVVCNADEGEPGTFKDRVLLATQADAVFEGMTLAAWVLGARRGFLYLRGEYRYLLEPLQAALQARRDDGLLGRAIRGRPGFDFDIAIHLGAGAYVCGEESALIESLEGRRGTPRIRPPYPVERGWCGLPTVVNNVESFFAAAHIVWRGGAWWAGMGTPASRGTRLHSVSGDCARPGIYEYPFGTRVARILHDCGAHDAQAVQVGGPSGVCLSAREFGRRIAFEDVPSAGAFMVFDRTRDLFEVARGFTQFFAHESCGFCTPCRVGTTLALHRLDKLARGRAAREDLEVLRGFQPLLQAASHCGLGASACHPLRDTLQRFAPVYDRRLVQRFGPAFDLDAALAPARALAGRDDALAHLEDAP